MTSSIPPPPARVTPGPAGTAPRPEPDRRPPWQLWMAPAGVILGFLLGEVLTIFVEIIGEAGGSSLSHPTPAVEIVANVMFDLAFVAVAIYLSSLHGRARPADFGYRRINLRLGAAAFAIAGVGYYVLTFAYASVFNLHGTEKLPKELGVSGSTAAAIGVTVFVCVIAPVAEEFFFRGFLFGVLRQWRIVVAGRDLGTWLAAVVVAILFGLAHTGSASSQDLIPLGILGFVLCLVRWRTRSLYPCMALHAFNNCLALGVNQFHWNAGEVVALMCGSFLAAGAITWPLSARSAQAAAA